MKKRLLSALLAASALLAMAACSGDPAPSQPVQGELSQPADVEQNH